MHVHHYVVLFLLTCFGTLALSLSQSAEEFSEELLLRPLPDGKVLTHFQFTHQLPPINHYGHHHRLFPKAIYQLVQKFRIQEMEISFTQGRWNYNRWGGVDPVTRLNAKPSGVELWAVFAVPDDQIDATWGNLTHALSGLFCASLNFLDSPVMIANPVRAFMPDRSKGRFDACNLDGKKSSSSDCISDPNTNAKGGKVEPRGRVRYGALPREAICTENLTPWLKLLPCRDKAGLATLLDRPVIYKGWYHSLRLYVSSDEFELRTKGEHRGTLLQQTLSLVIQPSENSFSRAENGPRLQPSWSLSSLFGRDLSDGCPLAKFNAVYMEFEGPLVEKLEQFGIVGGWNERSSTCMAKGREGLNSDSEQAGCLTDVYRDHLLSKFKKNEVFTMNGVPLNLSLEIRDDGKTSPGVLLAFAIPKHVNIHPLDVGLIWKVPFTWTPVRGPFRATRFLVGSGNARGAIALVLKSNQLQGKSPMGFQRQVSSTGESASSDMMNVMLFQVVPWYIHLYLHTLKVLIDEQPKSFWEVVRWMQVVPSEDRRSPGVVEMELMVPCNATVITLITEFDKGFLRIDEHPPDANRGFDLPSALLSFPCQHSERQYHQLTSSHSSDTAKDSPLLQEFQIEKSVQVYTEVLLVPLATPDFSMPYNVITLTCTVLALYFGSLLNVLRRRIGEEERLANSKESSPLGKIERLLCRLVGRNREVLPSKVSRLVKFVLVAAIAVVVNYYLTNS